MSADLATLTRMPADEDAKPDATASEVIFQATTMRLESGQKYTAPSAERVSDWLHSLGLPGHQWMIVVRVPADDQFFFQTFRASRDVYEVEIREGSQAAHVATYVENPEAVLDLLTSWHREDDAWRTAATWVPQDQASVEVDPDPELLREAEAMADQLLTQGLTPSWQQLAASLVHRMRDDGSGSSGIRLVWEQATTIAEPMWADRVAEQTATWSGDTDCDTLAEVFGALQDEGIVARPTDACCGSCGAAELGGYLEEDSTGYVFFHAQDIEDAVAGAPLLLRYGAASEDGDTAAVGHRVVERVRAAGLTATWDGDPRSTIEVPLTWRKRLPTVPGSVAWPGV
jgi:hypothetical protein